MGVHGLWNLLEPVGKPVPLESLENKILAVDVSIWLHQATKGFRDTQGNPLPNAHLLGLCHRLCKLMFFKIKPVFVFDGGVPVLKRQTMALRNSRRDTVVKNNNAIAERILTNYIQSEVINKQLGKSVGKSGLPLLKKKKQEPDLFELPPIPQDMNERASESDEDSDEFEDNGDFESVAFHIKGHNIHSVDFSSEAFRALPVETQHEILLELRDTRKQSSWNRIHQMPQEAGDFSGFQMERLLKRRNLQQRLDEVVKEIGQKTQEEYALNKGDVIESLRIASDTSTRLILIKKALQPATTPIEDISKEIVNIPLQTKVSDKSIAIEEDLKTEVDLLEGSNEFSQQELFAILGSAKQKSNTEQNTQAPSSSDDDSDFEEVPSHAAMPGKQIILDIPINPALISEEEDDMFADVFGPLAQSKEEKISNQFDIEKSPVKVSSNHEKVQNSTKFLDRGKQQLDFVDEIEIGHSLHAASVNNKSPRDAILLEDERSLCGEDFTANRSSTSSPDILESHFTVAVGKSEEFQPTEVIQCHSSASEGVSHQASTFVDNGIATSNIENVALDTNVEKSIKTEETHDQMDLKVDDEILIDISDDGTSPLIRAVQPSTSVKFNQPKEITAERKEELEELDRIINREQSALIQQHGKQERIASSITDQMYIESQQLLRLFGIPYLVAPMEAEAQCAFLDEAGLTQGTITDDSDIWLFGGRRVYKNFFNQGKYVQFFEAEDIHRVFKLGREKLVHLALLTGSDYTEGIQGVGPVGALEILAEFPNEGLEALEQFRDWLQKVQAKKNAPPENKIRQKMRNLQIRPGFPNRAVVDAYIHPEINQSRSRFSWTEPDVDALRDYLNEKIGWNREKFNSVVAPVLERFNSKDCQTRIDSYFSLKFPSKTATVVSKRVMEALRRADFGGEEDKEENNSTLTASNVKSQIGTRHQNKNPIKRKKAVKISAPPDRPPIPSTSGNNRETPEIIWQKEKDKQKLAENKMIAIELFKKSKGRGKRPAQRKASSLAHLSESDSNSS